MSSLDFSREDNEQILDRILRHLTGVLVAAEGIRRCGFSRGQAQLLRDALRADEILLSSEQKSRAASFLAKEMEILCNLTTVHHHVSPSESLCSQILTRHTEILSSVLRKEMKRQLNETLIIATNTGNIRYNFDDPAALLHRALEILHDHGGPGWATTMEQNPELNDIEHAHDLLNVSSAHEYVLNVVTHTAVRKRVADGRLDRLQGLAQLVRQVASPNDVLNDYLLLPMYDFQKTQTPQEEDDDIPQAKRRKFGSEKLLEEKQIITPVFGKKSVSLTPTSIASLGALYDLEKLRQVLEESQDIVREFAQIAVTYINYDRQQRKNAKRKRTKLPKSAAASVSVFIFPALCDEDEDDFLQDPGI
uniref:Uncharacterized protein n=1 Tax=Aureoumbra lagunensis TaxID=44058 RepID=A0A7S3K3H7_9STRA